MSASLVGSRGQSASVIANKSNVSLCACPKVSQVSLQLATESMTVKSIEKKSEIKYTTCSPTKI